MSPDYYGATAVTPVLTSEDPVQTGYQSYLITFTELKGSVPLIQLSAGTGGSVTRYRQGDTPYRRTVQVIKCSLLGQAPATTTFSIEAYTSQPLLSGATLAEVEIELSQLGYGQVTVTCPKGSSTTLCSTPDTVLWATFDNWEGDVPALTASAPAVTISLDPADGALSGIAPLWGSFTLAINGETTPPIALSTSAEDLQATLANLYTLQDVTVRMDAYGVPYTSDLSGAFYSQAQNVFTVWTVTFRSKCYDQTGLVGGFCAGYDGDESLFAVDDAGVRYAKSVYLNQERPTIGVRESRKGYAGNVRQSWADLSALSVALTPRNTTVRGGTTPPRSIGMQVQQQLECTASGRGATFSLVVVNDTILAHSWYTVADLAKALNGGTQLSSNDSAGVSVAIVSTSDAQSLRMAPICGYNRTVAKSLITFTTPSGAPLPLMQVVNTNPANVTAVVRPVVDGVDGVVVDPTSPGRYTVTYTPTVAGAYDLAVRMMGVGVVSDLGAGVVVTPSLEYSAASSHNASQVATQGVREYVAVQLRDVYGNALMGAMSSDSSFLVTLVGTPAACSIDTPDPTRPQTTISVELRDTAPITDGLYSFAYTPTVAGSYGASYRLLTRGGLLATYYKTANQTQPVLASRGNFHDGSYHLPYWCDGLQRGNFSALWEFGPVTLCDPTLRACGCDSTRLDRTLDFDWGDATPLPWDEPYSGKFPADFYSVKWEGYVSAPGSGEYAVTLAGDYGVQLWVGGVRVVDAVPMKQASVTATVTLTAHAPTPIVIVYYHQRDRAFFKATWRGPGLAGEGVLTGAHLSYARHLINSPLTVQVYPGAVAAETTTATGTGLANCTAMSDCVFEIQARDAHGNPLFNNGGVGWNVTVLGVGDWAGYGNRSSRINELNYTAVQHVTPSVTPHPASWVFIGMGDATHGQAYIDLVNTSTLSPVSRGDTILVGQETMLVADYLPASWAYNPAYIAGKTVTGPYLTVGDYGKTKLPLARPYLGPTTSNFRVYKLLNCTTGRYSVSYRPTVRGAYLVHIQTPSVSEVQAVSFYTTGRGSLTGNYTLTATTTDATTGLTVAHTTPPLLLGTVPSNPSQLTTALSSLPNLAGVTVATDGAVGCGSTVCRYTVTFLGLNDDLPMLTIDLSYAGGNELVAGVEEVVQGRGAVDINQSPFALTVAPGPTHPATSAAYGQGLSVGTTGLPSPFSLQTKDAYGNNRLTSQEPDTFAVHAFLPTADMDSPHSSTDGSVAARPDGVYSATYTPTRSGQYTLAVMLATIHEVHNITANVSARAGWFVLQYGSCRTGLPCATTKRLAWNTDAAAMADALSALPGVGGVRVTHTLTTDARTAAWVLTYLEACDKEALTVVESTVPSMGVRGVAQGACSMVGASNLTALGFPYVNPYLVGAVQRVATTCSATPLYNCQFMLSFRGLTTPALSYNAPVADVKAALEALESVGTVNVTADLSDLTVLPRTVTYTVSFTPWQGATLGHLENYGPLPLIQVVMGASAGLGPTLLDSANVTQLTAGVAPYSARVEAVVVSAAHTTAVDSAFTAGSGGLHGGVYMDPVSFVIEARDGYGNRVQRGPVAEVQVIETVGGDVRVAGRLGGFITVGYKGALVRVAAQAGIAEMQSALQSLPTLGQVTVTTGSCRVDSGLQGQATRGDGLITVAGSVGGKYSPGDWIRLSHPLTGPVYTVLSVDATDPSLNTILLSGPYTGPSAAVALYAHPHDGYQYIVTFDSNLGDLPALTVTADSLYENNNVTSHAYVTACDQYSTQLVTLTASGGTFSLAMGGETTPHLPFNAPAATVAAALESFDAVYAVTVALSASAGGGGGGGSVWTVTFVATDVRPSGMALKKYQARAPARRTRSRGSQNRSPGRPA